MHILLTNDDGISARGIRALAAAFAAAGHRVSVCAPDRERSAASHSVTLKRPLRAVPVDFPGAERAWAVDGTPADCASLGLFLLRREDPADLLVSGINRGMNLGGAAVYSGTVAAAMEASMCGTPAMASSLCVKSYEGEDREDYGPSARLSVRVAEWMEAHPLPRGALYSLNVPPLPYEQIRGLRAARLSPVYLETAEYEVTADAEGLLCRYRGGEGMPMDDPAYDLSMIDAGWATLTKLTWDFRLNADDGELNEIGL